MQRHHPERMAMAVDCPEPNVMADFYAARS